jgi:hypothetical protein
MNKLIALTIALSATAGLALSGAAAAAPAPVVVCDTASAHVAFGSAVDIPLSCQVLYGDPADPIDLALVTQPVFGTVSLVGGVATYTSTAAPFGGVDAFTYRGTDTRTGAQADPTPVTIVVGPAARPVCADAEVTTRRDHAVTIAAQCTSPSGRALTYSVGEPVSPSHGTATIVPATGVITYTPRHEFRGDDIFSIAASDGFSTSMPAAARVHVVARGLQCDDVTARALSGVTVRIESPCGEDDEHDDHGDDRGRHGSRHARIAVAATHGTARVTDSGRITYTSDRGFVGRDAFTVEVTDAAGATATSQVAMTVRAPFTCRRDSERRSQSLEACRGREANARAARRRGAHR